MIDNQKELVDKMIKIVEDIVKENDKEQFDTSKQTAINKTIAKVLLLNWIR